MPNTSDGLRRIASRRRTIAAATAALLGLAAAPATAIAAPDDDRRRHAVDLTGETKTVLPPPVPGKVTDRGTIGGAPFGDGKITLVGDLSPRRLEATIRMRFADGSLRLSATLPMTVEGNRVEFRGTARITGGTGAYRGATGRLRVHDTNTLNGQNGRLTVTGTARF